MEMLRRFIANHYGESVELKYRMFCICASLGTLTSLGGFVMCSIIVGLTSTLGLSTLFAFLLMITLTTYGFRSHKVEKTSIIISAFLNLGVFPLAFLITGALYSVAPMFFIMGILIAVPLLNGRNRTILFFIELFEYCIVIMLCYFYPQLSYARDQSVHTTMLLFSFIIVSFYLFTSTWMIVRHYDIEKSKSEDLNYQLSQQVIRDPLTHLYNRRYLMDFLEKRFLDKKKEFAIAMLDIDDFKKINDSYGHLFGDEVLNALSKIMEENIHGKGFVSRYGGEEFIIYFDSNNIEDFIATLKTMKSEFKEIYKQERDLEISFSAGIVLYEEHESIATLLDKADDLLYVAKSNQKDKLCYGAKHCEA